MGSSPIVRLRGIFATTSDPRTASAAFSAISEPETLVMNFKRACRSNRFRSRHVIAYFTTVGRLAAAKQFSLIEEIIQYQKQYKNITNEGFTVRLISLYGKSGMFSHAQELFDEMPKLKCERTVKSFGALLSACVDSKEYDKIPEIFANVSEKLSIKPNVVTYTTVIKAFCEMGSFGKAFSVIEEMEKNGVEPNEITFNTLLEGFYRNDRFSDAEKVLEMMKERNVVPNCWSYNPKLRALASSDRVSEAAELIEEMIREGVEPDKFSYNALIIGFCGGGNMEEAKRWFGEITKNECKPDRVTYVSIGYLACKNGDFDYAFELCKEAMNGKVVIDKTLAQLVVDGLLKESRVKEAKELVELGNSNKHHTYDLNLPQSE